MSYANNWTDFVAVFNDDAVAKFPETKESFTKYVRVVAPVTVNPISNIVEIISATPLRLQSLDFFFN